MDIYISLTIQNYGDILGLKYAVISEAWPREGKDKLGSRKMKKLPMRKTQAEMGTSMYLLSTTAGGFLGWTGAGKFHIPIVANMTEPFSTQF